MEKRYPRTILASACIPWDENMNFDEDRFRKQIRAFVERGVYHLYLFGTAGEGYAVTDDQYKRIVTVFAEEMKAPEYHPMVGQIQLSLPIMLQRIEFARTLGIKDFQISLPSWGALNDEEMFAFFHRICDSFPDCRFLHYNLMRTKRLLTPEEYVRLAREIPNFAGAKFTTLDILTIHKLLSEPSPLQFFLGELGFGYGSMIGECGLLISIANSHLSRAWEFYDAAITGDTRKTIDYMGECFSMLQGLLKITGTAKIDGAYDKMLVRLIDADFPLRLQPPYSSYGTDVFERYRSFLQARLPQWLETS